MSTKVFYADRLLLSLSVIIFIGMLFFAYRTFDAFSLGRILLLLGALIVPSSIVFLTSYGKRLWRFLLEARKELFKVVHPSTGETIKMSLSLVVLIFLLVLLSYFFDLIWSFLIGRLLFGS